MDQIKSIAVPIKRRDLSPKRSKRSRLVQAGASPAMEVTAEFRRQMPNTDARPSHRYGIGQRLAMARGSREITRAAASCQVTALVPHEAGPLLYRVRSDTESFERIVDEIDLAPL